MSVVKYGLLGLCGVFGVAIGDHLMAEKYKAKAMDDSYKQCMADPDQPSHSSKAATCHCLVDKIIGRLDASEFSRLFGRGHIDLPSGQTLKNIHYSCRIL